MSDLPPAALDLCRIGPAPGTPPGVGYCLTHYGLTAGPLCSHVEAIVRRIVALAWDIGYLRGTLDATSDLEPADNPYAEDGVA